MSNHSLSTVQLIPTFYECIMIECISIKKLAAIEYMGLAGITSHCLNAIARLIHFGDTINSVKLLTFQDKHSARYGYLLNVNFDDSVAIKSGFSSGGYGGEGENTGRPLDY